MLSLYSDLSSVINQHTPSVSFRLHDLDAFSVHFEQVTVSIYLFFHVAIVYLHNLYVNVAIVCMFFLVFIVWCAAT